MSQQVTPLHTWKSCLFGAYNWTKTQTILPTIQGNTQVTSRGVTWVLPSLTWSTVYSVVLNRKYGSSRLRKFYSRNSSLLRFIFENALLFLSCWYCNCKTRSTTTQATEPKLCCIFNRLLACASIKHGRHCILFWKRTSGGGTVACGGGKNFQLYPPTELHCSRKLKFCQTTKGKIWCCMLLIL